MAKFFLKLGSVNKKLIMPIVASILYMIMNLIEYFSEMSELHILFDLYTRGISYSGIIIIPIIQKCLDKSKKKNKEKTRSTKKKILDFSLLYLEYILYFAVYIYLTSLKSKDVENTEDFKMSHYYGLCSEEALEIVFIVIISKFLLKTKLYIHHYLGLIVFIILSLSIDIPFNLSIFKPGIYFFFIYCIYLLLDSIFITYEKYMMDKLYYSPFIIVFSIGLLFLATSTLFVIIIAFKGNMLYDGKKYKLQSFSDYFEENGVKGPIVHIIYLTSFRFVLNILKILTIYYFTQNHIYTTYILIKIFDLLLKKDTNYKYFSLLLFVFQFLGLLVFLEIIELNFLGLNKNTKKNIGIREIEEETRILNNEERTSDFEGQGKNNIEFSPGYFIESEMAVINDEERGDCINDSSIIEK